MFTSPLIALCASAKRLKQQHSRRVGCVQRIDTASHRDADDVVALVAGQAAEPLSFRADDDGGRAVKRCVIQADRTVSLRAEQPYTAFLEFIERGRKVVCLVYADIGECARRRTSDSRGQTDSSALRDDNAVCACGLCRTDDGTQIMRVLE